MKGFRICRIFGIDIELHWSLIILVALIAWSLTSVFRQALPESSSISLWAAGIFSGLLFVFSVIFHELAHSFAAKIFKIQVPKITIFLIGGVAYLNREAFKKPARELLISIVGPLSSFLLAGIFIGIKYFFGPLNLAFHVFGYISLINIILAVFNLIPCFPMDGGRFFRAICFWKTKNFAKATRIARDTAVVTGTLMIFGASWQWGLFSGVWIGFIVWFVIIPIANQEYQRALLEQKLKGIKAKDLMVKLITPFPPYQVQREIICRAEDEIIKVIDEMSEKRTSVVFIENQGVIIGKVTRDDILSYLKGLNT